MFDKGLVKGCLGVVVGLACLVGVMLALTVGGWWWVAYDEAHPSPPRPERIRFTADAFHQRSEQALEDTVGALSPGLALTDTGYSVERNQPRATGEPSRLSFVDRRLTARTRISASHRLELKSGIEDQWRRHDYKLVEPIWTPSDPQKGTDYNFSAEATDGVTVYVSLVPGPDRTLILTLSIHAGGVEYSPGSVRPSETLRPDAEDTHWST
ncbi:hypothetical protein SAMN05216371_8217 [Streptomyces sp. TLI_053]|uniref:hypothetical protein n=1 Tax=Streptomyces sp. TLI_053 TaxID=1855352 RepID=UPI00087DE6A1|nr:hypothetical protein [Streptomyces sp. TLI_053]SDT83394.1 hypothetical protein SAMN05216371_8217 [Streptomyces sp. TLI_053]